MAESPSPWNLGGLTVRQLAANVWREMSDDEITDRAAALAYYFLFALFPTLLFLTALLGMLPLPGLMERLIAYVEQAMPGEAASIVRKTFEEIQTGASGGLLSFGFLARSGRVQRDGFHHDGAQCRLRHRGQPGVVDATGAVDSPDPGLRDVHPLGAGPGGVRPAAGRGGRGPLGFGVAFSIGWRLLNLRS
jgi:hypothetical protein